MYGSIFLIIIGILLVWTFQKRGVFQLLRSPHRRLLLITSGYHRELRYIGLFLIGVGVITLFHNEHVHKRVARMFSFTSNDCKTCDVYTKYSRRLGTEFDNNPSQLENFARKCDTCDKNCHEYANIRGESVAQCSEVARSRDLASRNLGRARERMQSKQAAIKAYQIKHNQSSSDEELMDLFPRVPIS